MRAGRLNRKVVVQQKTATTDTYGGPSYSWATYATLWAGVYPARGREIIAAMAERGEMLTKFVCRYVAGITEDMRLSFDGKYYNIVSVIDVNDRHKELQIMATTGTSEG